MAKFGLINPNYPLEVLDAVGVEKEKHREGETERREGKRGKQRIERNRGERNRGERERIKEERERERGKRETKRG